MDRKGNYRRPVLPITVTLLPREAEALWHRLGGFTDIDRDAYASGVDALGAAISEGGGNFLASASLPRTS